LLPAGWTEKSNGRFREFFYPETVINRTGKIGFFLETQEKMNNLGEQGA